MATDQIDPPVPASFDEDGRVSPVILILDDMETDRLRLKRTCRKAGLKSDIDMVSDIAAFRAALDMKPYDIVFLDYNLGMETGLDALQILQKHDDQMQAFAIMVTSVGQHDVVVEAMRSGCADYIVKEELSVDSLRKSITTAFQRNLMIATMNDRQDMRELTDSIIRFLQFSAPEMRAIMDEMMRRVFRIRTAEGASSDARLEAQGLTRNCGDVLRILEDIETLAEGGTPRLAPSGDAAAVT